MKDVFILRLPSVWRLVKPFAVIREGYSELQLSPSLSPMVEMGQKGALKGELGFHELFWQSKGAYDCGCWIRGLHHLFIVFSSGGVLAHGFWKPYGLGQLFRVFSSFSSLFYVFSSLLGIFAILEEFWIFLEEKRGFLAFWRHFKWFYGFLTEIW